MLAERAAEEVGEWLAIYMAEADCERAFQLLDELRAYVGQRTEFARMFGPGYVRGTPKRPGRRGSA